VSLAQLVTVVEGGGDEVGLRSRLEAELLLRWRLISSAEGTLDQAALLLGVLETTGRHTELSLRGVSTRSRRRNERARSVRHRVSNNWARGSSGENRRSSLELVGHLLMLELLRM
jgi:hypothetical protein